MKYGLHGSIALGLWKKISCRLVVLPKPPVLAARLESFPQLAAATLFVVALLHVWLLLWLSDVPLRSVAGACR